jgi:hypothetical protein
MSGDNPEGLNEALQRQRALARWENEGGAVPSSLPEAMNVAEEPPPFPKMDDAEFQALHVRIIALENLVIAMLAAGSDQDRALAGEMASYISPRPGFTRHPLTTHAAAHMSDLVERAVRFSSRRPV